MSTAVNTTTVRINKAYCKLALLHPRDNKSPGESIDTHEFRQASIIELWLNTAVSQ